MNNLGRGIEIDLPLTWRPLTFMGGQFEWHKKPLYARHLKTLREKSPAQVYRWLIRTRENEACSCYVGQSDQFEKRLRHYRRRFKSAANNEALIVEMKNATDSGGWVSLELLEISDQGFSLNGIHIDKWSMGVHEKRVMLEAIAIVTLPAEYPGVRLINHVRVSLADRAKMEIVQFARERGIPAARDLLTSAIRERDEAAEGVRQAGESSALLELEDQQANQDAGEGDWNGDESNARTQEYGDNHRRKKSQKS